MILTRGSQFRGDADLGSWIYRITTNHCLNRLRGERRRIERDRQGAAWTDRAPASPYRHYELKRAFEELLDRLRTWANAQLELAGDETTEPAAEWLDPQTERQLRALGYIE